MFPVILSWPPSASQRGKKAIRTAKTDRARLVLVPLNEEGLVSGRLRAGNVLAEVGLGVGLRARLQLRLRGTQVLGLSLPRLERRLLERAAVREGERPVQGICQEIGERG